MRNFFGVKATSTTAHVEQPAAAASTSTTTLAPRLASEEGESQQQRVSGELPTKLCFSRDCTTRL